MLAPAPSPLRPDALLAPLPPGEAYAADVARLDGREPIGPADDAWLALGLSLARAADLPVGQRTEVLIAGADCVAALVPDAAPAPVRGALLAAADGLRTAGRRLGACPGGRLGGARRAAGADERAAVDAALAALQAAVAQQEQAGAFVLAFGTLADLRRVLAPVLDRRGDGLLLAQQARAARQLGSMATAAELYAASARAARAARAPDVAARALIGGGVLASMRGNYPEARDLFRRGLAAATQAGSDEHRRAAHHGLLVAAVAARDVETALAHGWAAFSETAADASDDRAEMLLNLGEVGRQAGEYRASLGACLAALELTDSARLRLPALGCAAIAAARLGEHRLLEFLVREVERTARRSGQPYEVARAFMDFADAYVSADVQRALAFADQAESLAAAGGFHEVTARADAVRTTGTRFGVSSSTRAARSWTARAQTIFASLETLPTVGDPHGVVGLVTQ